MRTDRIGVESRPLAGKGVLVTRAREQADALAAALAGLGAEPLVVPAIAFEPPESWEGVDRAAGDLGSYDWVVFTSANGVSFFLGRLETLGKDVKALASARIAAIGPATAAALARHGLAADLVPPEFVAESVASALVEQGIAGRRVLLPRAAGAREVLVDLLEGAGARVDEVTAYRTVGSPEAGTRVRELLAAGRVDAVTFTSSSTVRCLLGSLDGEAGLLADIVVACIGPVTAVTAREYGLRVDVVAAEYTVAGLVRALEAHYGR